MIEIGKEYIIRSTRPASKKEKKEGIPYHVDETVVTVVAEIPLKPANQQKLFSYIDVDGKHGNAWEKTLFEVKK